MHCNNYLALVMSGTERLAVNVTGSSGEVGAALTRNRKCKKRQIGDQVILSRSLSELKT